MFLLEKSCSIYSSPRSKEQTQAKFHTQSTFSHWEVSVIIPMSLASWPNTSKSYMQRGTVLCFQDWVTHPHAATQPRPQALFVEEFNAVWILETHRSLAQEPLWQSSLVSIEHTLAHPNPNLCFMTNQIDSSLEGFDSKEIKTEISGATQTLY